MAVEGYTSRRVVKKKKLRWGRLIFVLLFLSAFLWCTYWLVASVRYVFFNDDYLPVVVKPTGKEISTEVLEKQINVLVMGLDGLSGEEDSSAPRRTDTMLLASFDLDKKNVAVLSIPRDTRVKMPGKNGYDKINHAYAYGGEKLARQAVANFLNIPVHHYVLLDANSFVRVVDVLGGVGLYVENDMNYEDPYQGLSIHLKKGYQRLNGEQSIKYIKFRSDELGDIGRVLRQQKFLKAVANELLDFKTLSKTTYLQAAFSEAVVTDMHLPNVVKAMRSFKSYNQEGILFEVLPGDFATINGVSYWSSNPEEIAATMNRLGITQVD